MAKQPKRTPQKTSDSGPFTGNSNLELTFDPVNDGGESLRWPAPHQTELMWTPDLTSYPPPPQRERKPYAYVLTTPPEIATAELLLTGEVSMLVEDAARATEHLNASVDLKHYEWVASPLLRAEAISSSRIEGLRASHRSIAEARVNPAAAKSVAREIANSVSAMEEAIRLAAEGPLTVDVIKQIHRTLARGTDLEEFGGVFRSKQNWIGFSNHGPFKAAYVPPSPPDIDRLMGDLLKFASRTNIPAIAQAAIVHAQFEGIHPFADGNGRVGRTLVHVILLQRGLSRRVVSPISTALAANRDGYIGALARFQQGGDALHWISYFARATTQSARRAEGLSFDLATLVGEWSARLGRRRAGSMDERLIDVIVQRPIISAQTAARSLNVTEAAARRVLGRFEEARLIRQITLGRRNRVWAADEVFDLLDAFEHGMASDGDGHAKAPTRHLRSK